MVCKAVMIGLSSSQKSRHLYVVCIYIVVVSGGMKNLEEEEEAAAAFLMLQIKEGKNVRQLFSSSITT